MYQSLPGKFFKLIINAAGLAFIAFCFYSGAKHAQYLSLSGRPSQKAVIRALDEVVNTASGKKMTSIEVFEKYGVVSATVNVEVQHGLGSQSSQRRMERAGWRRIIARYGERTVYCKESLVAEETPLAYPGAYHIEVSWGSGDAICR